MFDAPCPLRTSATSAPATRAPSPAVVPARPVRRGSAATSTACCVALCALSAGLCLAAALFSLYS